MNKSKDSNSLTKIAAQYVNTTGRNIFLTGRAGTGKTTFLRDIAANTHKKCLIAAPTGIAAINAGGVTLHSLLQLPFGGYIPEEGYGSFTSPSEQLNTPRTLMAGIKLNSRKRKMLQDLELLIIDEVSMLRADTLDAIDQVLRHIRRNRDAPFGGLQILFIGDLLQLPPVAREEEWNTLSTFYGSTYFFESRVIKDSPLVYIELETIFRQSDQDFIEILNNLRNNQLTYEDTLKLNRQFQEFYELDNTIFLTTHNRKADRINQAKLAEIENELVTYKSVIEDDFPENMYPAPHELHLKLGAQIMFIKNDPTGEQRFFNGKLGEIIDMTEDTIEVLSDSETIELSRYNWENKRYSLNLEKDEIEEKTIGIYSQFPIRLAWAITIHKSQGLTFDRAVIDIGDAFAPGQIYVALSRLTSLEGLTLTAPVPEDMIGGEESVLDFGKQKTGADKLVVGLKNDQKKFLLDLALHAFDFSGLHLELREHLRSFGQEKKKSPKQSYIGWTQNLLSDSVELEEIGKKFRNQLRKYDQGDPDFGQNLADRLSKASDYFTPRINQLLERIRAHVKDLKVKTRVTGYRKEVQELLTAFQRQQFKIDRAHLICNNALKGVESDKKTINDLRIPSGEDSSSTNTADITYQMYSDGLGVELIAEKRGLAPSTIENHLSKFVESGELDVFKLVEDKKVANISTVIEHVGSTQLGPIKSKLGDEYTYSEVRYVVAHWKYTKSKI